MRALLKYIIKQKGLKMLQTRLLGYPLRNTFTTKLPINLYLYFETVRV